MYLAIQAALSLYPSSLRDAPTGIVTHHGDVVSHTVPIHDTSRGLCLSSWNAQTEMVCFTTDNITYFFKIEFMDEYTSRILMNDTNTVSCTILVLGCAFYIGAFVLMEGAQRTILREKASGQDFLAMHPVAFLFSRLTKVPNDPPGTPVVNTPIMLCSHTTLITHHLSVGHGLVDPNRQEFESFEHWSVEGFMWAVVCLSVSLVFHTCDCKLWFKSIKVPTMS